MPPQKIILLKKANPQKFYANAQNTLSFFLPTHKPIAEKKMKECFLQRFIQLPMIIFANFVIQLFFKL